MDFACGMAARTVSSEIRPALGVENSLGHDRTGGVSRAEKQDVVVAFHLDWFRSIAACWGTTRLVCSDGLDRAHKATEELAVDLIGIKFDWKLARQKFPGIFSTIDSGGFNLNLFEPGLSQLCFVLGLIKRASDATNPREHTLPNLRQDFPACDHIRYRKTPTRLQNAECFAQNLAFICRKIDDAIRDDHVYGIIRQRNALDLTLQELNILDPRFPLVLVGESQHFVGHVETIGFSIWADTARRQQNVDAASRAQIEHRLSGLQLRKRSRISAAQ